MVLALVLALAVGLLLGGPTDTDDGAGPDLSPLPAPTVGPTATAGWWGTITFTTTTTP